MKENKSHHQLSLQAWGERWDKADMAAMRVASSLAQTPESERFLELARASEAFGQAGIELLLNKRYAEKSRARFDWAGVAYCATSQKSLELAREAAMLYIVAARSGLIAGKISSDHGELIAECARLISSKAYAFESALDDLFNDPVAGFLLRQSGIDPAVNQAREKPEPVKASEPLVSESVASKESQKPSSWESPGVRQPPAPRAKDDAEDGAASELSTKPGEPRSDADCDAGMEPRAGEERRETTEMFRQVLDCLGTPGISVDEALKIIARLNQHPREKPREKTKMMPEELGRGGAQEAQGISGSEALEIMREHRNLAARNALLTIENAELRQDRMQLLARIKVLESSPRIQLSKSFETVGENPKQKLPGSRPRRA